MSEEADDQKPGPSQTTYETLFDLPAMLASDSTVAASGDSSTAATATTQKNDRKPLKTFEEINVLFEQNRLHEAKMAIRENAWPLDSDVRRHLWPMLCARHRIPADAHLIDNNNAYLELVMQIFSTTSLPERPIMLPVFVDANHCFSYFLTAEGKAINDRVISTLAYCQPDITFSPYLYSISAVLLHFLDELDSYNCLASLIASKDKKLITQTKLLYEVTWKTVMQVSKKYAKSSVQHLTKYDPHIKLERIFADWIWWIFNGLPFEHLVRVIDCFLNEGVKVLYRVAMAILILFERVTSNPANDWSQKIANSGLEATLYAFVREIPFTASKLLKVAFKIRGLGSAYIGRVFLKTEMVLKSSAQFSTATGGNSCVGTLDKASATKQLIRSKSSDDVLCRQQTDMDIESSIINNKFLSIVWGWLPIRLTICKPILLYTTEEHGCSIRTFFKRVEEHEHTLMLIKTVNGEIFGAYCSMSWQQRNLKDDKGKKQRYFGTGESFLFSLEPNSMKYPWVGITKEVTQHSCELFMAATNETIYVGGGEGNGILINGDLRFGKTDHCQTFDNPPLCENTDFEIKVMEVFGFSA